MNNSYLVTQESVFEGHADKMADQISDAILDFLMIGDNNSKANCETILTNGLCLVAGEIQTTTYAPIVEIARDVIRDIGYTDSSYGVDYRSIGVFNGIGKSVLDYTTQNNSSDIFPSDIATVHGFATNETPTFMPFGIFYANKIARTMSILRKNGTMPYLRPDGKVQLTTRYIDDKPAYIEQITILTQHIENITKKELTSHIIEEVIRLVIPNEYLHKNTKIDVNPSGVFIVGGPFVKIGVSGRKSGFDTYGGAIATDCGGFSGKDPTKIERSGSLYSRYIAKNIVASGLSNKVKVSLSYTTASVYPTAVRISLAQNLQIETQKLENAIIDIFDPKPSTMIDALSLRTPIYKSSAMFGYFGRDDRDDSWERLDKVEQIIGLV